MSKKIQLRYIEQIYDVEYNKNSYKVSIIEDIAYGDIEAVVMKYGRDGNLVVPTEKQRNSVLIYFNNNRD